MHNKRELQKKLCKIDEKADGVYVIPSNQAANIKIRDLLRYCKQESKESSQLSAAEIERFYR